MSSPFLLKFAPARASPDRSRGFSILAVALIDRVPVVPPRLEAFWGPARVFETGAGAVGATALSALDWQGVERALFRTGGEGYLTEEAAAFLIERRVKLVGIDTLSVDPEGHPDMPVHRAFARAGIAILECLRLDHAAAGDYELVALPLAIEGADASPVRAALRSF